MTNTKLDNKVQKLIKEVEKQKSELGTKPKMAFETNAIINTTSKVYNLNTINDLEILVMVFSQIVSEYESTQAAAAILEVESNNKINGFTFEQYSHDFKLKAQAITWEQKKKQLDKTQKRLNQLLSDETKTALELDEIANSLSS